MLDYQVYLEVGAKNELLMETNDYKEADDFLWKKWGEIRGEECVVLIGGNLTSRRQAVHGNPLTDWEEARITKLTEIKEDIARHGDVSLEIRGLVTRYNKEGREYVSIV